MVRNDAREAIEEVKEQLACRRGQGGEFNDRPQKRYDHTEIIVSEPSEYGYDHDRGKSALR